MLRVEDGEHSLIEAGEKFSQRIFKVDFPVVVVGLQVFEEVDEDVGVAFVDDAVRLLEELVELQLRFHQQVHEGFWKKITR